MQLKLSCHNMYSGWATTARGQHRAPAHCNTCDCLVVDQVTVPPPIPGGMDTGVLRVLLGGFRDMHRGPVPLGREGGGGGQRPNSGEPSEDGGG